MSIIAAVICFFLVVGWAYSFLGCERLQNQGRPLKKPPKTLPVFGNGILFLQERHKLLEWFAQCEQRFGLESFQISVPTLPPCVVINDPKNLEFIFKNEEIFGKGAFFKTRSWDLFGHGIINVDGPAWKVQRKAGLNFLSTTNLQVLLDKALPDFLQKTSDQLRQVEDTNIVDMDEIFLELTTQLMGEMAYGMEMHVSDSFSRAFNYASGCTASRFQNPLWRVTELLTGTRFRHAIQVVKQFGLQIVTNAIQIRKDKHSNSECVAESNSGSLINSLLDAIDDEQLVADAALNYLSAGRDTVAQALSWTMHLLLRHPKIAKQIRLEHESLATTLQSRGVNSFEMLNYYTTTALPYTHASFLESLRLYPPVPFELKQCIVATNLPDGTHLPSSTVVAWCPWAMNRSLSIWGTDAGSYRPERWLDRSSDGCVTIRTRPQWEFPVFNGGARMCLGKRMAEEMSVRIIATLLANFDFEDAEPGKIRRSRNSLTLPMDGGLPCYVRVREQNRSEGL